MHRIILLIFLIALSGHAVFVRAQTGERLPVPVADALKAAGVPPSAVAVLVQEVDARLPRSSYNTDKPMNPASVMKLVTTEAGLELLGPAYVWKTEAWISGTLKDGVLEGDLILKGYGDPRFGIENFWLLLRQLRARGLREIRGNLVLDRRHFAPERHDPAAFDNEPLRPYNAGPDALLLNFNAITLTFMPQADGQAIRVLSEPTPLPFEMVNLIKPAAGACGNDWHEALRMDFTVAGSAPRLVLTGNYPLACAEKTRHVAVPAAAQFVAGVFRALWMELGGSFQGGMKEAALPAGARLLAASQSPTLAEVVHDINKFSNNVMARQLFLALAAQATQKPANLADARQAVRDWLSAKGMPMAELSIENGSGLSRSDRISADSLGRLLAAAWASPVMPEFIASLPIAGIDGTMKKRLNGAHVAGQAHVKTGYLDGVRALAGYVLDRRGKRVIVVFLANHPNANAAKAAQDALLVCAWERSC